MTNRTCLTFAACAAITLLFAAVATTARAAEGDFSWALGIGGPGSDFAEGIAVDSVGNVYVTGAFTGTVDFDPGPGVTELTSPTGEFNQSIFVAKYSPSGALVWARVMGGSSFSTGRNIAVDAQGNVFVTGWYNINADLDPGPGEFIVNGAGGGDVFVVKLNTNGIFEWAYALSNFGASVGQGLALDSDGNVYVTGHFEFEVDFDPSEGTTTLESNGLKDIFVVKLNPAGALLWARHMGGAGNDEGQGIAVGPQGNVHITGSFSGPADFNPDGGGFEINGAGATDAFVATLNDSGAFLWARGFTGAGEAVGSAVVADSAGAVVVTGQFGDTVDFDSAGEGFELTSTIGDDAFVAKLGANGGLFWAGALGVPFSSWGTGVAVDAERNVYSTGSFVGINNSDFDPGPGTFNLTSAGANDGYISKLDPDGNFVYAKRVGGTGGDWGADIAISVSGAVHVTGRLAETGDFDPGFGQFELTSAGGSDIFVMKLEGENEAFPVAITGVVTDAVTGDPLACASVELQGENQPDPVVAVTDENGVYIFGAFPPGTYNLRVLAPGFATLAPEPIALDGGGLLVRNYALDLRAAGPVVAGRVIDSDNGLPLVGVFVRLFVNGEFVASTYTCASGFYEIPLLLAKDEEVDIEVEFSLENYEGDSAEQTIDPALGATVDAGLQKSVIGLTFLVGRVTQRIGAQSSPLPAASVTLRGPVNTTVESTPDGTYAIDTLIDGSCIITASAAGFEGSTVQRTLVPAAGGVADFELEPDSSGTPGDINNDGVVNAVDVQLAINAALGIDIDPSFDADINGDSSINAVDVQLVINAALGVAIK